MADGSTARPISMRTVDDDDPVVPDLAGWDFAARERELFASAPQQIPTWRLANQSRRLLASVVHQLSNAIETPTVNLVAELPVQAARELAATSLGGILVRSTGAILSLIGCGYEREALAPFRVATECTLRGLQLAPDASGDVARQVLEGRRPGSLKAIANKFGEEDEAKLVAFLDHFSHADPRTMLPLTTPRGDGSATKEADVEVRPQRGVLRPANQLLMAARASTHFSVLLSTEVFDRPLIMPAWISGQLIHYKDNPLPVNL